MADQVASEVDVPALRQEGQIWTAQSAEMRALAQMVGGLDMSRLEAGIFQIIVGAYGELTNHVEARCTEGAAEMAKIGSALQKIASEYEQKDQSQAQQYRSVQ